MLSGSFMAVSASQATAPAPRASRRRSWPTSRQSRREYEGSLRTGRCPGSFGTRCYTATERRRRAACPGSWILRRERARDLRARLAPEDAADELAGPQDLRQVDTGFDAQAVEHVDHVLGRDVAGRAPGVGAAAETRHRAVEGSHARFERGVDVRERLPVGIVVVAGESADRDPFCYRLDHRADAPGRSDSDRVAERDLVAAHLVEFFRERRDRPGLHFAFVGAARCTGDVAANAHLACPGSLDDRREALEALRDAAVDVLPAERFGGGAEYGDLRRARGARRLEAFQVRHQHRVGDARFLAYAGEDLRVVGHLRHPFRRYEGGRFDRGQACLGELLDEFDLDRGGNVCRLVLKAVARPHLDDLHFPRKTHGSTSKSISSAPSTTCSPTRQRMRAIRPRAGALMVCSIFIASRINKGASLSTRSPGSTRTATILPGIGAASSPGRASASSSWSSASCSCRAWCSPGRNTSMRLPRRTALPATVASPSCSVNL